MFGCWSLTYVEEENFFPFENFDPMKLQNSSDLNRTSVEPHELHCSVVKTEQEDQILESSIDVKMEKVNLIDILDGGQGEVCLEEKEGVSDGDMMCVKPELEDLNSELPNKEEIFEGESDEEGSTSLESESDSGDSSSDESSSDESMSAAESLSSSEDEEGVGMKRRETGEEFEEGVGMKRRETGEEFEEGEVREFDAHMIDFLSDEEVEGSKGPIRSKHEVEDLPPVPLVEVTLQANHQLLPVGVISSIMGNRVIVEGSVLHNPLNEGSILWVMDTRLPLGLIDEIFGPIKNPYYIVRYNTEEEVPAGIRVGVAISFVAEFASQILNDKELYRKGYDASGENDEEVDNEVEFSDDEKEAECKKSLREGKSAINQCKGVKQARFKGKRNNLMRPRTQHKDIRKRPSCGQSMDRPHPTGFTPHQPAPLTSQSGIVPGSWSSPASATNADLIPPPTMPQYPQAIQGFNYLGNPSHQLLTQHQETPGPPGYSPLLQNTGLQGDHSMQFQHQNVVLNNIVNMMAFQQLIQQFVSHQGSILPWIGASPSLQPLGQNNFAPSPPFSYGFTNVPGTPGLGNEIIQGQASLTPGLGNEIIQGQSSLPLPPSVQFNGGSSTSHFNGGSSTSHFNGRSSLPPGRRPYQRGGGRLFNRGGRQPNR